MLYLKWFAQVASDLSATLPPSARDGFAMVAEQNLRAAKADAEIAEKQRKERASDGGNPGN